MWIGWWLGLLGCAPDFGAAWTGDFEAVSYGASAVTPTDAADGAAAEVLDCEADPPEAAFGDAGFRISLTPYGDTALLDVDRCASEALCDGPRWVSGGTAGLDDDGGTAKLAATSFLANSAGGGECVLQWWTLTVGGSPDAPALHLAVEQVQEAVDDTVDCEALLDGAGSRACVGVYRLDGRRW